MRNYPQTSARRQKVEADFAEYRSVERKQKEYCLYSQALAFNLRQLDTYPRRADLEANDSTKKTCVKQTSIESAQADQSLFSLDFQSSVFRLGNFRTADLFL